MGRGEGRQRCPVGFGWDHQNGFCHRIQTAGDCREFKGKRKQGRIWWRNQILQQIASMRAPLPLLGPLSRCQELQGEESGAGAAHTGQQQQQNGISRAAGHAWMALSKAARLQVALSSCRML